MSARVVVLASGTGSNLQALLDAAGPAYPAQVVAVGADRDGVPALERAAAAGVPSFAVRPGDWADRAGWDGALAGAVAAYEPDLVVCAGFLRLLGPAFLARFAPAVVNTHPALLPAFAGARAVADALAYGVRVTGVTVHLVDAGLDTGPVVAQACVEVRDGDDVPSLHERIKAVERPLLVDTVAALCRGFTVEGRRVRLS